MQDLRRSWLRGTLLEERTAFLDQGSIPMTDKKRIVLLVLGGILLVSSALLFERQSKTQSALQQAERELEYLEHNNRLGQTFLAQMADSLSATDRSYVFVVERLRQGHVAANELSELITVLQEQLLQERIPMWVCGICGFFLLMLCLRRVRQGQRSPE